MPGQPFCCECVALRTHQVTPRGGKVRPYQSGGIMKRSRWTVAVTILLCSGNSLWAQSQTDILRRLEALEESNAQLQGSNADLKKENAALRDRVRRIESTKPIAYGTTTIPSSTSGLRTAPGYAGVPP